MRPVPAAHAAGSPAGPDSGAGPALAAFDHKRALTAAEAARLAVA
ncbi:hypothetical protein [Streptomyces sp. NPDC048385]|uniref:Uncharacterized protein n=1 Tax=Streptomyces sp. R39 TaxID=3238631 RepID=A0AB39R2G0_9ACTN